MVYSTVIGIGWPGVVAAFLAGAGADKTTCARRSSITLGPEKGGNK
jgi:hypothetical protein